jgi:hypothetical protein
LKYTDPSGEFVQYIIGGIIGGINGYMIANATGQTGWNKLWYTLAGAGIGAGTAGIGTALSASMGTILSSTISSAAGGASFSFLSGHAQGLRQGDLMRQTRDGLWKGAVTGLAGGFVSAPIGGGWSALAGGAASGAVGALLNGENPFYGAVSGGAMSYAMYHANAYINWKWRGGNTLSGGQKIKYSTYNKINADWQRSRFTGKERGGWLFKDGSYQRFNKNEIRAYSIHPESIPEGAIGMIHSHWMGKGNIITYYTDEQGNRAFPMANGGKQFLTEQEPYRYHSPKDIIFGNQNNMNTYTLNRWDASYQLIGQESYTSFNDSFLRIALLFNLIR